VGVVTRFLLAVCVLTVSSAAWAECVTRPMRITFYTCAEGSRHCLTKRGNQPMPFRTVAVGDRSLLGRWLYIEDLGGWVLASDTGAPLKRNWIDVFIGDSRMARDARRLGVQHWDVRVCEALAPSSKARPQDADQHRLDEAEASAENQRLGEDAGDATHDDPGHERVDRHDPSLDLSDELFQGACPRPLPRAPDTGLGRCRDLVERFTAVLR